MKTSSQRKGFTLPEVMMALVISMVVFSAMGVLLSRCFSLWVDAQAHWKLAQHARVTRTRILYGGFGVGTGILSATNLVIAPYGEWRQLTFNPVSQSGTREVYGWTGTSPQNIWLKSSADSPAWAFAQSVSSYGITETPLVTADDFIASLSNQLLTISYTLNFSAMGKNFEHPQTIQAYLVNE